MPTPQQQEL